MFLSMLIACPAERLGVEVPSGGPDRISAEDLQRDVYALTTAGADAGEIFGRRMEQMHLPPKQKGEGFVCSLRGGEGASRVIVAPWPDSVGAAASVAVLISLAKGFDGQDPPARATWLCVAKPEAALPDGERIAAPVVEADRTEAVDYRRLRDTTKKFYAALLQ